MIEIIAEIGQNHNGDMELAKKMIWQAKEAGADVAKFQLYEACKLFTPSPDYEWFDYNCKTELSREQAAMLAEECQKAEIEFMASVFDAERLIWLEELGVKRHKVASRTVQGDPELVESIYATGKPVLMSLGMWDADHLPHTPDDSRTFFLHCISKYPTPLEDVHLEAVDFMVFAGFSDHTIGTASPIAAMARGAQIIEKHFTLNKQMEGPDHLCSATVEEFAQLNEFRIALEQLL